MKSNYTIILLISLFYLVGCKSSSNESVDGEIDSTNVQGPDSTSYDLTADTLENDTLVDEVVYEDPEVQEAHEEIVKKYGIQWDFCTCVQKSDSVNTALGEASEENLDKVWERSDYIDSKCKGILIQPNATPEDRYKHEKKVKKCLAGK